MIEPALKVQFFTHAGGQSVAYSVTGSGPPLVVPAWWVSHLELDWQQPEFCQFFSALAQHHQVIRYDRPGVGLSDRQRDSFDLDDEVSVLGGLIDHLQLSSCALLGISCGGPVAINYAALFPQRVSQLVLVGSFVHGADIAAPQIQGALCSLVSAYWGLGSKAIIDLFNPDMATAARNALGRVHRQSASAEMAAALLQLTFAMDARAAAARLQTPALVIHRNKDQTVAFDAGRRLASCLGNAQLLSLEGRAHLPWFGEQSQTIVEHVLQFTGAAQGLAALDDSAKYRFRQQGDTWLLQFGVSPVHLKDSLGLQDLAFLLGHPHDDIHVMQLYGGSETVLLQTESPLLDTSALRQLRQRLADIDEDKTEAAAADDDAAYQRLEAEQDDITRALRQGLGIGGRQRQFDGAAEKARKAVSARVRATIKRIAAVAPELAAHLQASVRTGNYCSYCPDPKPDWQL